MPDIIGFNFQLQTLHCRVCHACIEVPRYVTRAPEAMYLAKEAFAELHASCGQAYIVGLKLRFFSRPYAQASL